MDSHADKKWKKICRRLQGRKVHPMTSSILSIVLISLQILYAWMQRYFRFTEAERQQHIKALQTWTDSGKLLLNQLHARFDQDAYLSAVDDLTKLRFIRYQELAAEALGSGAGLEQLIAIDTAGFGLRATERKEQLLIILVSDTTTRNKADSIAALLAKD